MNAPTVVPSTVVEDSEVSVPHAMPVDSTYTQYEMNRQGALSHATVSNHLFSPKLSGAKLRGGSTSACASVDHLQPIPLDGSEDSRGLYVVEDLLDCTEAVKLGGAGVLFLSFGMSEVVTTTGPVAPARATLTDG
ncbi:hypothetical protein JIQ42_02502 [Leishmania sp. Namibia]|uniref:hypothetical protein n=1 Tax=Leishmania sp. Namibia TaxID=2802991 RepID=UPI001B7616A6|nr:hypothetical protein JIQ42_02502 [Leishmania sp. Namibia]